MNPLQPARFYVAVLSLFLAALAAGVLYFLGGMSQTTFLVSDGARVVTHYLDKPRYDMHLQGLIFALSFLGAGALLLLLVLLPDREERGRWVNDQEPPQPRRRPQPSAEAPQPARAPAQPAPQAAPAPAAQSAPSPHPVHIAPAPAHQTSPLSIEGLEPEAHAPPHPVPAAPEPPGVSVEEEVLQSAGVDDLPLVEAEEANYDDTGEEDVVYGSGRITENAAWEFVQTYPDSSVKFLYRKSLDNKQLTTAEQDIYRNWEQRGLTRSKVRQIVLEIMSWQALPENFPHEIWRQLRDQIYEMKAR